MDLTQLSKAELIAIIYKLVDHVETLTIRIADLEEKISNTGNSSVPPIPSFVKQNVASKKKKKSKRKQRTHGYARAKDIPTHQVFHSYSECPDCKGVLGKPSVAYTRTIIDIPVTPATITEHVIYKRYCTQCHTRCYPKPDVSSLVVGTHRIGITVMALIATLKEELRLPVAKIQQYIEMMYGLRVSTGEIIEILHQVATRGKTQYEAIKKELLESPSIHGDETGGRENGKNGYFWNFSTDQVQYVMYRKSRGSKVVREVLGEDGNEYEGVLVTDFYAAYNEYAGFHQRCWVHYVRDIHHLTEEHPGDLVLKTWARAMYRLYARAKRYRGPSAETPIGKAAQLREEKEAECKQALMALCEPYVKSSTVFSRLASRGMKYVSELFTFVRFAGVSSDNNTAERAVRHLVVGRKISGGTRSQKGSVTKSILTSLFGTWRLQHSNPFEQTKLLLLSQAACQQL